MANTKKSSKSYVLVMILYLAGIFMGAIDTGIVTPARTIIQNQLGVSEQTGIWMITIYTLAYAASVPIMGKLADRFGRKYIYILCITLFGLGSLLCGLSGSVLGFPLLIAARIIQAIGGGGIVPIATAEFGTTFPPEKRGMALGLVGGVYGIANVFGASAGSAILDLFGTDRWEFIFYINIPISLFIVICGLFKLENNRNAENNKKIDIFGIFTLTVMVLSLLYGLKNLDFFDFGNSVLTVQVWPFLLVFLLLVPLFILAEKKAEDPVISLRYFTNRNLLITLILSTISGFVMMSVIFVPSFAENCLHLKTGSGGYLVIMLGLFAGVGAPISGKLIDKFGAKIILAFGFLCSAIGALFMMLVTTHYPSMLTVLVGLALTGLGMGFTMGTPVNYMMLAETDENESNSALAALSLVRSVGTAIAPAIMAGFVAAAGMNVQSELMPLLPQEVTVPELPYVQEIEQTVDALKQNEQYASMFEKMPALSEMTTMKMDMTGKNGDFKMPDGAVEMLQNSDVTTIVDNTKLLAQMMFDEMTPGVIETINAGIDKGVEGVNAGVEGMKAAQAQMAAAMSGASGMPASAMSAMGGDSSSMSAMGGASGGMDAAIEQMETLSAHMSEMKAAVPDAFDTALENYQADIENNREKLETCFRDTLNKGFADIYLMTAITAALALVILAFYRKKQEA